MKKVFLIEDNEDHAFLIKKCVEDESTQTVVFSDGLKVFKALENISSDEVPDLILLDLQLPGMNGFEILTKLKQTKSLLGIPVVMLTTSKRQEEIEKAYQLGASGFVVKSENFDELMEKMKHLKNYWFHVVESPLGIIHGRSR